MEQLQLFADDPNCQKCGAKAPLNRPWYTFHEKWYTDECLDYHREHIHMRCRRCSYDWMMTTMSTNQAVGGTRADSKLRPSSVHKVDSIANFARTMGAGMSSYLENSERFEEEDKSLSRKIGWRKPHV